MKHKFPGAALDLREGHLVQQRNRIIVQLAEAHRVQIAEQADAILIPAPPKVTRESPEALLGGGNEAVEHPRLTHDRCYLRGGFHQHADVLRLENARLNGLYHEHALKDAAVDQRNAQKRLVLFFARLAEKFESGMLAYLVHRDWANLLRHKARETFVQREAQRADALAAQSQRGGEHEVGAVRLQQIGRTNVGVEAPRNQGHHIHQSFGGLAAFPRQISDFFQS